jgi:hypothetical protein
VLLLASTTDKVNLITGSAADVDVHVSYVKYVAPSTVTPGRKNTKGIVTAVTTDITGSPAASEVWNVKTITVRNKHATVATDITIEHTDGTNNVQLKKVNLAAGEEYQYVG